MNKLTYSVAFLITILFSACSDEHEEQRTGYDAVDMKSICYTLHEIDKKENVKLQSLDSNTWELRPKDGEFTRCAYLGSRDGWNIIFQKVSYGGSGTWSYIYKCKEEKGKLKTVKLIVGGDRACDGIYEAPIFDEKDSIYFYRCFSLGSLALMSGIKEKDIKFDSPCAFYWNMTKCVYNFKTDKIEIISIDINWNELTPELQKILSFIKKSDTQQIHISKQDIPAFFEKFKNSYLGLK